MLRRPQREGSITSDALQPGISRRPAIDPSACDRLLMQRLPCGRPQDDGADGPADGAERAIDLPIWYHRHRSCFRLTWNLTEGSEGHRGFLRVLRALCESHAGLVPSDPWQSGMTGSRSTHLPAAAVRVRIATTLAPGRLASRTAYVYLAVPRHFLPIPAERRPMKPVTRRSGVQRRERRNCDEVLRFLRSSPFLRVTPFAVVVQADWYHRAAASPRIRISRT